MCNARQPGSIASKKYKKEVCRKNIIWHLCSGNFEAKRSLEENQYNLCFSQFLAHDTSKDPILLRTPEIENGVLSKTTYNKFITIIFLESEGILISFATIKFGPPIMSHTYVMIDLSDWSCAEPDVNCRKW